MSSSVSNLSNMTGMSEVELQRRAQEFQATGKLTALNALEQLLISQTTGPAQKTVDAYNSLSAGNVEAHVLDEPAQVLSNNPSQAGFAAEPQTASLSAPNSPAELDKAADVARQKISGFLAPAAPRGQAVSGQPAQVSLGGGKSGQGAGRVVDALQKAMTDFDITSLMGGDEESRTLAMEKLKRHMQIVSEGFGFATAALSNAHETGKGIISNLRA